MRVGREWPRDNVRESRSCVESPTNPDHDTYGGTTAYNVVRGLIEVCIAHVL